ncbi:hypothetical protein ACLE20_06105 [Rhizobium sp. YIM 134829]|uniref:hypothetical protein n=1 Tax=Rhizobium sp. YIM 134829 TaxID=3390453 RepID=UPI003978FDA4
MTEIDPMTPARLPLALVLAACFGSSAAWAETVAPAAEVAQGLTVELNALAASERGCKLTFVAGNALSASLTKVSFEFVLFDPKGRVERMATLDFRDLPAGKTKVRQFDLPGTQCEALGSLLINDAPVCSGEGIEKAACMRGLQTGSKAAIALKG